MVRVKMMAIYTLKKLLWLVVALWLLVTLLFFLIYIPRPHGYAILAGDEGPLTPEQYQLLFGRPIYQQYGEWIWNAVQGDLGQSLWTGEPVTGMISERLPYTFSLMIFALVFSLALTIPIGVISARKRNTFADYGLRTFQYSFMSIPVFWIGTLIFILSWPAGSLWRRVEPVSLFSDPLTALRIYILPAIIIALSVAAIGSRLLRSSILKQKWSVTEGSERVNYVLPMISVFAAQVSLLLGATVIMEPPFYIPGLGTLLISAVNALDLPVIMGAAVFFGVVVLGVNFLVDIIRGLIDPRVRSGTAQPELISQIMDY